MEKRVESPADLEWPETARKETGLGLYGGGGQEAGASTSTCR